MTTKNEALQSIIINEINATIYGDARRAAVESYDDAKALKMQRLQKELEGKAAELNRAARAAGASSAEIIKARNAGRRKARGEEPRTWQELEGSDAVTIDQKRSRFTQWASLAAVGQVPAEFYTRTHSAKIECDYQPETVEQLNTPVTWMKLVALH